MSKESEIVASLIAAHDESYQNGQACERAQCLVAVETVRLRLLKTLGQSVNLVCNAIKDEIDGLAPHKETEK